MNTGLGWALVWFFLFFLFGKPPHNNPRCPQNFCPILSINQTQIFCSHGALIKPTSIHVFHRKIGGRCAVSRSDGWSLSSQLFVPCSHRPLSLLDLLSHYPCASLQSFWWLPRLCSWRQFSYIAHIYTHLLYYTGYKCTHLLCTVLQHLVAWAVVAEAAKTGNSNT